MAEVVIVRDRQEAGALVAGAIASLVRGNPRAVLGLATGSTPLPVYEALVSALNGIDVSQVRGFALDEYVGIPLDHPESYRSVITREVVVPLGLVAANIHVPDGTIETAQTAGARYEAAIASEGGIDLQILGIGSDGHIGFNEPGSSFGSRTRVKTLTEQTRIDNARFFDSIEDVPRHCITQGLGTIRESKHAVMLAFGEGKAAAVAGAVEGPMSAMSPGSALQLHPHATIVVDEAAASELKLADYYRYTYANKPEWQTL